MKAIIGKLIGSGRPKVIAVFGVTRADVEYAARHARTGGQALPVWGYCTEPADAAEGCDRFLAGVSVWRFREELKSVWIALSIVAWNGQRTCLATKLMPFLRVPFRVLILNEAGDFSAATPFAIARHLRWRSRDAAISAARRTGDWAAGLVMWSSSVTRRSGEKVRDIAEVAWSLAYRSGQQVRDAVGVLHSLLYRGGERFKDACGILRSLAFRTADYGGSLLLAGGAEAAEWLLPRASRRAVNRLKNRKPHPSLLPPVRSASAVEITITGRVWPRQKVLAALDSTAGFVVFRCAGEQGCAEALIALAINEGAFAAAPQMAHSAWRSKVVSKHPFRKLQPDEVAEVFAPFAPLIVLRREALARLGCPKAFTFGAALMLIFWKAAAAGWKSLAAGHDGLVTDEPAMALEDAELALRVTLSRALRTAGPAEPHRLRGNVATAPAYRQGFRGKPRVLVVSPYLPFPLSHGGAVRIFNLCRELSGEIDFILACFHEANETVRYDRLHNVFREVHIVDVDEKQVDPTVPLQVCEYRSAAMSELIRRLRRERDIDLLQLEYTQLAEYRECGGAVPVLLVEHDITFTLYRQLAARAPGIGVRRQYARWLDFEREALQCCDLVWTMSEHDRSTAIQHGAARSRNSVVPNGVDLERFQPVARNAGPPCVLFVGSFRHLPNLLAFEALRDHIMPLVWQHCPDAKLHVIAGFDYQPGPAKMDSRIRIEGFVEDVRPAYTAADVVVIPLPVSAGTNIKMMEAMACGRAVVSTAAGCRGLGLVDGRELIVTEADSTFADAIVGLLRDESLRLRIGREARRTAERRFGWDAIAREALASYRELTATVPNRIPAAGVSRRKGSPK